jgi:hypothetical protein
VKAMAKTNSKGFQYLSKKCPNISTAKLIESMFVGYQIREILEDEAIEENLIDTDKAAWEKFQRVSASFLRRKESHDFGDVTQKFLNAYKKTGYRMSLKVHFSIHI